MKESFIVSPEAYPLSIIKSETYLDSGNPGVDENISVPETTKTKSCTSAFLSAIRLRKILTCLHFIFCMFLASRLVIIMTRSNTTKSSPSVHNPSAVETKGQFCIKPTQEIIDNDINKKYHDRYTIVVSTYNRDNELIKNVDHWLSCPQVHQVQIIWHDPYREPPHLLQTMLEQYNCTNSEIAPKTSNLKGSHSKDIYDRQERLLIRRQEQDMLSNRFRAPSSGFQTEAVFNIDDDAVVDCRLMSAGFEQWKLLGQFSLVGFEPRQIDWNSQGQGYKWYSSCEENSCEYNTLWPTKGAFLHRNYYTHYWDEKFQVARELVDKYFTGEDILMTFVHYSTHVLEYNKPPPILSIQATRTFQRAFFDKSDRFSWFQKLLRLPAVLLYRSGIGELNSLGVKTSWHRGKITETIGKLSQNFFIHNITNSRSNSYTTIKDINIYNNTFNLSSIAPLITPPMTRSWYFLFPNSSGYETSNVCNNQELFDSLQCTTKESLTPLNNKDAELLTVLILLILAAMFGGIRSFISHRRRMEQYERVRLRKVSCGSPNEF